MIKMLKQNLFKDLNELLVENNNLKSNYRGLLTILLRHYKSIEEQIVIEDYLITKKHHYLSFKKKSYDNFIFIDLTNECLELRFLSHELITFFDETEKFEKLDTLLNSFFEGEYEVEIHSNKKGEPIYKKINWKKEELNIFDEAYELSKRTEKQCIEKFFGIDFKAK